MATVTEILKPPVASIGILGWLRKNLFSSWYNLLLTILALAIFYALVNGIIDFVRTANWAVVTTNLRLFMVGRYPVGETWRVQASVSLLALLLGASWGLWRGVARTAGIATGAAFLTLAILPFETDARVWLAGNFVLIALGYGIAYFTQPKKLTVMAWLASLPLIALLLYGVGSLPRVTTDLWGGLLLTFALAVSGIALSFPLGVLMAIGRQSSYPVIRAFSVLYIEIIRGVPLVTVLFTAQIVLPIFLPEGFTVERVVRAIVGFTLFTSAYLAETVRGGLQSIGRGQGEAARALGLNSLQVLGLITLPQALRAVIPAMVGQFISLFKDTSLVAIVGLLDLAGIANAVIAQKEFLGLQREVLLFIAVIYFIFASSMSYASRRLERSLGVGER